MSANSFGHYSTAIVSRIADNFISKSSYPNAKSCTLEDLRSNHQSYIDVLRKTLRLEVIELPSDEDYPDNLFVEESAVVLHGIAFMCKPRNKALKGFDNVKKFLSSTLKLSIYDISDENAFIDGEDIFFTGEEFFVGMSKTSNVLGALSLANAFIDYPVTIISLPDDVPNLKSRISMGSHGIIIVGASESSQRILKQVVLKANKDYTTVTVKEDVAANVLFLNSHLIHRCSDAHPDSIKILGEKISEAYRISLDDRAFEKLGATLSNRCLLI